MFKTQADAPAQMQKRGEKVKYAALKLPLKLWLWATENSLRLELKQPALRKPVSL